MLSLDSFNQPVNVECIGKCNKKEREEITEDSICRKAKSGFDSLPVRCVGEWATTKIHFLTRYLDIFAKGMADKWQGNINYIEICSGPGICIDRSNRRELLGTALSIAQLPSFNKLFKAVFIDYDENVVDTLNSRFDLYGKQDKAVAITGDYNHPDELLELIRNQISPKGLSLIFFDPTDCSVPFETIATLKKGLHDCDLIINVFYGLDPRRWLSLAYDKPDGSVYRKYCRFLGSDTFLNDPDIQRLHQASMHGEVHKQFIDFYKQQLRTIGFIHFAHEPIRKYYDMLFASAHEKGIEFWTKVTKIEDTGQKRLF
ncbi:MAG: three-Cys-motif partner protein TcmP [Bacteroidales bacterium]